MKTAREDRNEEI